MNLEMAQSYLLFHAQNDIVLSAQEKNLINLWWLRSRQQKQHYFQSSEQIS